MLKVVLSILYIASCIFIPWYVTVFFGVFLIAYADLWPVVILGGLMMDLTFGAPVSVLFGFSYVYSALFIFLSILALFLRQRMLE